jgi:hypothetical protein
LRIPSWITWCFFLSNLGCFSAAPSGMGRENCFARRNFNPKVRFAGFGFVSVVPRDNIIVGHPLVVSGSSSRSIVSGCKAVGLVTEHESER